LSLFFVFNSNSKTGELTLIKEIKINDLLLFGILSLILIFSVGEIESIRETIEKRHGIKLPDVDVKYSDNIDKRYHGFTVCPEKLPEWYSEEKIKQAVGKRDYELKKRGLKEYEIEQIDKSKYTIFLPKSINPVSLYGAKWEELGHVAAYVLDIEDETKNESIALAYRFKGLLQAAKEGLFKREEVTNEIESNIKSAQYEKMMVSVYTQMEKMGLKVPNDMKKSHYYSSLFAIQKYNSELKFRDRDLDELIVELDKSIDYTLKKSKKLGLKEKILGIIKLFLKK